MNTQAHVTRTPIQEAYERGYEQAIRTIRLSESPLRDAASALLEALEEMVANYEPPSGHKIGDKARAAIAKAQGGAA